MARKTTVTLIDDIDENRAADETVEFGIDGITYEIDLANVNAEKLRKQIEEWAQHARRVSGRYRRGSGTGRRGAGKMDREQSAAIRAWAAKNGHKVSTRGRIPEEVVNAYNSGEAAPAAETKQRAPRKPKTAEENAPEPVNS
ncbi:Lsr2-like DNA bridging protein [Mycobacterium phage Aegeus]|nr:Lsr2-like DNA bridging protein [Mycobacterium phage Baudelaire]WKW86531.1 Lsr2-like DNA bridging protein [Mycobacterium phage Aegeus]